MGDNIKMDLREVRGGRGMDWIGLAHDTDRWRALVKAVMNLQVPQNAGYFLTRWGPVTLSHTHRSLLPSYTFVINDVLVHLTTSAHLQVLWAHSRSKRSYTKKYPVESNPFQTTSRHSDSKFRHLSDVSNTSSHSKTLESSATTLWVPRISKFKTYCVTRFSLTFHPISWAVQKHHRQSFLLQRQQSCVPATDATY